MRVLTMEEMKAVCGGYMDKDGVTHLDQISFNGRSDSAGEGGRESRFGKRIGQGTYQNGDIITRINLDAKTGKLVYQVYNKNTVIHTETDERVLLQKLTAEFGPRFGTQPIRRGVDHHN